MSQVAENTPGVHLLFTIAQQRFAIHSQWTAEIFREFVVRPAKVVGGAPGVVGIVDVRGKVMPLVDVRTVLGHKSFAEDVAAMADMVKGREKDHVDWLEELRRCVKSGEAFQKAIDPTKCAFGKWYEGVVADKAVRAEITSGSVALESILANFDGPHRRIHAVATRVLDLAASGKVLEANAVISKTWDEELGAMRRLFAQFFAAYESARRPTVVMVRVPETDFAMHVDSVDAVVEFQEGSFEPLPQTAIESIADGFAVGIVRHQENLVMRVDPRYLVATLAGTRVAA